MALSDQVWIRYLLHYCLDKGLKGTVVNRVLSNMHGGHLNNAYSLFNRIRLIIISLWIYWDCKKTMIQSLALNSTYVIAISLPIKRWTRINLNSNRIDPLYRPKWRAASTGPTLSYMPAQFQLWWRGQTFCITRPIIGLFDLPH